ncbi:MAG: DUF4785 family protein [Legionella sp.]|nr:DUF4785 family protein [Legionella sp.]
MKFTHLFLLSALSFSQAEAYTLPQHTTKAYDCEECIKLPHERLQTSWRIAEIPLNRATPTYQKSYSYNQRITAKQLRQGVILSTRAPGAVVRITPLEKKAMPELELKTPQNISMTLKEASTLYNQDEVQDESLLTAMHHTMMQIKPELGFGSFVIQSKNTKAREANAYLINVFDKFSLIYLEVEPDSMHYQYGELFNATITLKDYDTTYSTNEISASLIGSDDKVIPLKLTEIKRNQFQAKTLLRSELNAHGDNWYIETEVVSEQDDGFLRRTARAAFSYSVPSASLISIKKTSSKPLSFAATIDVATASRYALQSILFSKNAAGEQIPVETSQSAQWLEPGKQTLKFSFDNSQQLADDTLSVGYLHLTDYGQLKTVYQYNQPIKLSQLMD